MGDEAYKAWGLRATIVAMRPLTHPSPSLHRTHYGLLHVENSRAEISAIEVFRTLARYGRRRGVPVGLPFRLRIWHAPCHPLPRDYPPPSCGANEEPALPYAQSI